MEPVNFKGLNHWPIGYAKLSLTENDKLKVSNLQRCSDGVLISTQGTDTSNFVVSYDDIEIKNDRILTSTYFGKDGIGRIKTLGEQVIFVDPADGVTKFAINSRLFPDTFTLIGEKDGTTIFRKTYNKSNFPHSNWIVTAAIAAGVGVATCTTYEHTTKTDEEGNTTTTETYDWNCPGTVVNDVKPTGTDQVHSIDRLAVEAERTYPSDTPSSTFSTLHSVHLKACGINEFFIKGLNY